MYVHRKYHYSYIIIYAHMYIHIYIYCLYIHILYYTRPAHPAFTYYILSRIVLWKYCYTCVHLIGPLMVTLISLLTLTGISFRPPGTDRAGTRARH